jgi:endonuclease/exonuclease/phosphatase family metal-dependent hydrolase
VKIVTWNVLHRIHAMNWSEPAIDAHPNEAARIAAITKRVIEFDAGVVCLQEVSGDQLASLRAGLPDATFYVHTYPRVPKPFRAETAPLADPTEHLVTILNRVPTRRSQSETYPTDKGKGFLMVELVDGLAIVNTHVSYGDHHASQCGQLTSYVRSYAAVVIVGDFNEARATCREQLPGFAAAMPPVEKPTRPRRDGKNDVIDHIFVSGCKASDVEVLPGRGLSDHNPVTAVIARD